MSVLRGIIGMLCIAGLLVLLVGCGKKETGNDGTPPPITRSKTNSNSDGTAAPPVTTNDTTTANDSNTAMPQSSGTVSPPLPPGTNSGARPLPSPRAPGVMSTKTKDPSTLPGQGAETSSGGQ